MRIFLVFLVAMTAACGKGLEQEPNDHFTQATPVGAKSRMEGTLRTPEDIDIYRVETSRGDQTLSLHLGGIREVDFVLTVLDAERRELKKFDETSLGGDERAFDIGLPQGIRYVVVSNKNPNAANTAQRYSLAFEYAPAAGRESEPNDRALEANRLKPGGVVLGHYFPAQNLLAEENGYLEEDWFRIDVHDDGAYLLNLDVSEVPKVDSVLEIYGPNSYKIKEVDDEGPGRPEVLRGFGLRGPVHYFLRLRTKSKYAANPDIPYQILTELIPFRGRREFEANDQRLEATEFVQDEIKGTIAPAGDVDWFKLEVGGEGKQLLTARLGAVEGLDLSLSVADELGRLLLTIDNTPTGQPEILTGLGVTRGLYYFIVREKTGLRSAARQEYALVKTMVAFQKGLEYEINDSSAAAHTLEVGGAVDGFIAPRGDTDWYDFDIAQAADIRAEATGVLNTTLRLGLYDQTGSSIAAVSAARLGEPVTMSQKLEPGKYALRLSAVDPDHNNIRDKYTLRLTAR